MTIPHAFGVQGAGLGLRRSLLNEINAGPVSGADFLEVAPENWINLGGRFGRQFRALTERYSFACHGLSLNLGGLAPLDQRLLGDIKQFLDTHHIDVYSEHLSACADDGQLYDLMPVPFTDDTVRRIAARIKQVEDALERPLIIENVSAYVCFPGELDEPGFVNAVLQEADCQLLLDVNNVLVNSINFATDAEQYIRAMPSERIAYMHVAGHFDAEPDLKIDSHGAAVIDPVWQLLQLAYRQHGVRPTLLERDFNFPPLAELYAEVEHIRTLQRAAAPQALRA
ncbi:hypothetical protein SAMN05216271_0674 [Halopseudomonas sabulinigri]|uniref:Uncharacterized protein n=1 Tax=Halopseudomonas sabulinigri TaxID=472181 RepID=A0A1H1MRW1_9GAMM|nr:hypothetical protein SAMN05216271_0674 [Halopseudomonas sabulinigri]